MPGSPTSGERAATQTAVSCTGISFWYPRSDAPALDRLSLSVNKKQTVLLAGASGSGKSTLLRLLLGLVPHFSGGQLAGQVEVLGLDPSVLPPREMAARGVGFLFQNPTEGFVARKVSDEVAFGAENLGLASEEINRRVARSLSRVGLDHASDANVRDLSAGQQQRVALASILVLHPRLLLLDEPTAHLDDITARAITALIRDTVVSLGITTIIAEHRLGLVAPFADRLLVLEQGRVLADDPPALVLADRDMPSKGIAVPRATRAAIDLHLEPPLPLTPSQLTTRLLEEHRELAPEMPPARTPLSGTGSPILSFEHVSYGYESAGPIIHDVSFSVSKGEVVGLLGASGAGKSTLARLAVGVLTSTEGRVELDGREPTTGAGGPLRAALVLENPLLQLLSETVEEEILSGLRHVPESDAATRLEEMLKSFDLLALRAQHPLRLSEGQRRRVALAAAVAPEPALLVLDEPTLGQDSLQRERIITLVQDLAARGVAILLITHDVDFALRVCHQLLFLSSGTLSARLSMADPRSRGLDELAVVSAAIAKASLLRCPG